MRRKVVLQARGVSRQAMEPPLSATESAARIATGSLTATRLAGDCHVRIEAREPVVRAWAHRDPQAVREQARARDATKPLGPLHGVPVGVKDIIDTAALPTEHGSPIYAGHRPPADAACVSALLRAGAVVLGKTVTTEFAAYEPSVTRNPRDPAHTPGGSSSGSAAAVADGMVPLALGSQTAGSVVRPAAFCGVFGFKPTFGSVDRGGVGPQAPSLDTVGWFARHAEDLELVLGVLDETAGAPAAGAVRVAVVRTEHWDEADGDTRSAIETAASRLRDDGIEVGELELPITGLTEAQTAVQAYEAEQTLGPLRAEHEAELSGALRGLLDEGAAVTDTAHAAALARADAGRAALRERWRDWDAILTPAARGAAPHGLDSTGDPLFCRAWTLLGTPVLAVPGLVNGAGLPVGVQLVGPHGGDRALIALGGRLHRLLEPGSGWRVHATG